MLSLADQLRSPDLVDWSNPANLSHPLNRSLLLWWLAVPNRAGWGSFTWRDLRGKKNGALTTMDPKADWNGPFSRSGGWGCLDFDGSNDYVTCGDVPFANDLAQFTVSCWLYLNGTANNEGIVGNWNPNAGFMLWISTTNNQLAFPVNGATHLTGPTLSTLRWYHICGTYDGTNATLYVDGKSVSSQADTGTSTSVLAFQVGRYAAANNINAKIDDVRLLSRAYSAGDVAEYYKLSMQFYPGLLNRIPLPFAMQAAAAVGAYVKLIGGHQSLSGVGGGLAG